MAVIFTTYKMSDQNAVENLKFKLKSVTKRKIVNDRKEYALRVEERDLTEHLSLLSLESELILQRTEDLQQQISQTKYHIAMIDICAESEKSKIENHNNIIKKHTEGFEILFAQEREVQNARNEELRIKQAEADEIERQKQANILKLQEQKTKEAVALEEECVAIERECSVLVKRNKAIMKQLRRKLVEAEDIRRGLMKNKEKITDNNCQTMSPFK